MVSKLSDILPNPANPRTITESRFDSLSGSLDEFGDLSGVVYNSNPECPALISGHQRMKVFKGAKARFANVERYDTPEADGTVARGFIQLKDGTLFVYREVQWTKEKADRATIVANGQFGQWDSDVLANQWDFDVPELLDMGVPEFVLGLDSEGEVLDVNTLGDSFSLPDGDRAPFQQMTFTLADEQATVIKNALRDMQGTEEYKYAETFGNENGNGNALYLIVQAWAGQRILL